jgi:hypothetical protein
MGWADPRQRFNPPRRGHVHATMAQRDPEHDLQRTTDELEERLGRLEGHLGEAEAKAETRRREDLGVEEAAGDFEEVHDEAGGEDPSGAGRAKDDPVREG